MSLLERSSLPVRPLRQSTESLPGYIYRLYNANGHSVPTEIHSCLSQLYSRAAQSRRDEAAAQLEAVAGQVSDGDWPRWRACHGWLKQSYAGVRFCPACLQKAPFHQSIWELPLVKACPFHQVILSEQCDCGKELNWRSMAADWRCRCGTAYAELQTSDAAYGMVALSRLIFACFYAETRDISALPWQLPEEFERLPLEDLYTEIDFLHHLESKLRRFSGEIKTQKSPSASIGVLLADWPHSFDTQLQQWLEQRLSKDRSCAIVRLARNMPLIKLQPTFSNSRTGQVVLSISGERLKKIVECVHVPMQRPGVYLIDAALAKQLDSNWLRGFYMLTARKPESERFRDGKRAYPDDSRRATVMRQVINRFIERALSKDGFDAALRRVAQVWPALPDYTGGTSLEWLAHVIEPLHEACYSILYYLQETLESKRATVIDDTSGKRLTWSACDQIVIQ